ncbi:GlxA family transcriptional regulator [Aestuariicoccus sp. MJ-SS9]|uniref:GlxA family transcriptional regulator n=1 Tax=Aestuariicoccus sp. MJ-SS9 TaxID=3079855 RepID=UPI00290BAEB5|nr:helix-turn-helix domain-containing protein [Aestuariicoccus sp. MJ-SS9]MDU8913108.1 helix-turn-helix domain-containing protein [Aestuariicoccus sp. MJ-SS9]
MRNRTEACDIAFLLLPRFSNLCLSNCLEPLRAANSFLSAPHYRWQFLSVDGGVVRSSSDMPVQPGAGLADMAPVSRLYIISSYEHLAHDTAALRRALRRASARSGMVLGLDSGAWLMAAAGLLDGRQATIHWDLLEAFDERFHRVQAQRQSYVRDGDRVTCGGAMAAFDLTRDMIRRDLGPAITLDVEGLFRPRAPAPDVPQGDPLVARMVARMRARIEDPQPLPQLARDLGTTPRTLARRVQAATGQSPSALYRHLRLTAARQMIETGAASVTEVALRCGYEDPTALTRAFKARFGQSPQALRRTMAANRAW